MSEERNVLFISSRVGNSNVTGYTLYNPNLNEGRFDTSIDGLAKICAKETFLRESKDSDNPLGLGITTVVAPVLNGSYFEKPVEFYQMEQFTKKYMSTINL